MKLSRSKKKIRKQNSIDIFEIKKVEQWSKNDVFKEITSFEWVEYKTI